MHQQEGSLNILSVNKTLMGWTRSIDPLFRKNSFLRFSKLLLDFELIDFTSVVNHEVFGHGSVAREMGGYSEYSIRLNGFVWGGTIWSYGFTHTEDSSLFSLASGSGVNQVLGYEAQKYLFTKDRVSVDELFLLAPKLDFSMYLYVTANPHSDYASFISSNRDPARIVRGLCEKYYGTAYSSDQLLAAYDQMKFYSYYSFLDPGILAGLYSIYAYTFLDQYEYEIPGFLFRDLKISPGTRITYNPYGPDAYLDFYIKPANVSNPPLLVFYLRSGEFAGNGSWGTGFEFYNLKKILDGFRFDFWHQPDGNGFNLEMSNKIKVNDKISFLFNPYYKTRGYLIGKPFGEGMRLFGGIGIIL